MCMDMLHVHLLMSENKELYDGTMATSAYSYTEGVIEDQGGKGPVILIRHDTVTICCL